MIDESILERARKHLAGQPERSFVEDGKVFAEALLKADAELKALSGDYATMVETLSNAQAAGSKAVIDGQNARYWLRRALEVYANVNLDEYDPEYTFDAVEARKASMPSEPRLDGINPKEKLRAWPTSDVRRAMAERYIAEQREYAAAIADRVYCDKHSRFSAKGQKRCPDCITDDDALRRRAEDPFWCEKHQIVIPNGATCGYCIAGERGREP